VTETGLIGSHGTHRSRWAAAFAAATAVAVLLAGCTGDPDPGPSTTPTSTPSQTAGPFGPGADGLGDRYYPKAGNGGYDVVNYDLDVTYDPATKALTGSATITATATANLTTFNLDFTGLKTESVTVDGAPGTFQHADSELVITPASGLSIGTSFTAVVAYGGVPAGFSDPQLGETGFLATADGAIAIGEPEVASTWFPVNDHPRDKATYTIKITAPTALSALSNGVLQGKQASSRPGFTTWNWRTSAPMAPYLATMVVGNYRVQESTHDGMPVVLAVHTSLSTAVDAELAKTPAVVDFLESKFGPYPFDALGGIVINEPRVGFALENQTRPIYSSGFFSPGRDASWVIVHELAHQWFGDSVSVNEWNEIWLNEGFATYSEWLWQEQRGASTAQRIFDQYYSNASSSLWSSPPGAPGKERLFGQSVYVRGGLTLHALRVTVGDDAFFKILKDWAAQKKNANATTPEFIALAERLSGKELDQLFNDWLYGTSRPPRP
jgi:aminopeptidase N